MLEFQLWIYNVEQCRINVAYSGVDMENVRQGRNNVVALNVEFNVGQRQNNKTTTLWKSLFPKRAKKVISNWIHWIQSFNHFQNPLHFTPHVKRNMLKNTSKAAKILQISLKILHYKNLIHFNLDNINWFLNSKEGQFNYIMIKGTLIQIWKSLHMFVFI